MGAFEQLLRGQPDWHEPINRNFSGLGSKLTMTADTTYDMELHTYLVEIRDIAQSIRADLPHALPDIFSVNTRMPNDYVMGADFRINETHFTMMGGNFSEGQVINLLFDRVNNTCFFNTGSGEGTMLGSSLPERTIVATNPAHCVEIVNSLPRILTENITIEVGAGETDEHLLIEQFSGSGTLHILGALSRDTLTHSFGRIYIDLCNNPHIRVEGCTSAYEASEAVTVRRTSSNVQILACNVVTPGTGNGRAFHALWSENVDFENCMSSNRGIAFTASRCEIIVHTPSGENNTTRYHTVSAGEIRVMAEGTIRQTGAYATTSNSSGGGTYNARGEKVPQNNNNTGELLASVTHTVPADQARAFIDNLPRHLAGGITVSILPGTVPTDIRIRNFHGPGWLVVQGVDAAGAHQPANESTTQTVRLIVENNSCSYLRVRGIRVTSATAVSSVNVARNSCQLELRYIDARGGAPADSGNVGFNITENTGTVWLRSCIYANKNIGVSATGTVTISTGTAQHALSINNTTLHSGTAGAAIGLQSTVFQEGVISQTVSPTATPVSQGSGASIILPRQGRAVPVPSATPTEITVTPAQLNPLMTRLNQMGELNRHYNINVLPGTTTDTVTIQRLRGTGTLVIRAVDANGTVLTGNNLATHMIHRFIVSNCSNTRITIQGFRVTTPTNQSSIDIVDTTCEVRILSCNNTGAPATIPGTATSFVTVGRSFHVDVQTCTVVNQHRLVIANQGSTVYVLSTAGSGNVALYAPTTGSVISEGNATRAGITGTALSVIATGGIVNLFSNSARLPDVGVGTYDLGTVAMPWRDGHFSRNVIANGVTLTSDINTKKDIQPVSDKIHDLLMVLDPKSFLYRSEDDNAPRHLGLIAQEVLGAMEAVGLSNNDINLVTTTPHIEQIATGEVIQTVVGKEMRRVGLKPAPFQHTYINNYEDADEDELEVDDNDDNNYFMEEVEITGEEPVYEDKVVGETLSINVMEMMTMLLVGVQSLKKQVEELRGGE